MPRVRIVCPKCGEVDMFKSTEYLRRQLYIDANGDGVGSTDDECIRSGKPRCVKCGRMVKLIEQEEVEVYGDFQKSGKSNE